MIQIAGALVTLGLVTLAAVAAARLRRIELSAEAAVQLISEGLGDRPDLFDMAPFSVRLDAADRGVRRFTATSRTRRLRITGTFDPRTGVLSTTRVEELGSSF